jgi:polysaccharide export outer membrane protein
MNSISLDNLSTVLRSVSFSISINDLFIKGVSVMKAVHLLIVSIFVCGLACVCFAQQEPTSGQSSNSQIGTLGVNTYQLGPGDVIVVKVLGEDDMDGEYEVNGEGFVEIPFIDAPIPARCRTDREIRTDITTALKKIIRNPQVSVRVKEKRSRPPAMVVGAVLAPQQFLLNRRVRLFEVLNMAGGPIEGSAGHLQIFHTTPVLCPAQGDEALAKLEIKDNEPVPAAFYNIADVRLGKAEANPYVYPGDIVIVPKAPPFYVVGLVNNPQGLYWSENMTLTKAIAMVGGPRKDAKTEKVVVFRLKEGSLTEREQILINYKLIQKGQQKDFILQPYDIVQVDEASPWSSGRIGQTLFGLVTGGATSLVTGFGQLPMRVVY